MMKINNRIGYAQILGSRENQEDYIKIRVDLASNKDNRYLMIVTDGMGGYASGNLAAELAAEAFSSCFYFDKYQIQNSLKHSLLEANKKISDEIIVQPSLRGMGTTIIAAAIFNDILIWGSVGDSLLWLLRNGKLQRLNEDHSMIPILRAENPDADLKNHPKRHQLRSVLDGSKIKLIDISSRATELEQDDLVLIASDGVLSLDQLSIERIISSHIEKGAQIIANKILQEVTLLNTFAQDNASIAIYQHT